MLSVLEKAANEGWQEFEPAEHYGSDDHEEEVDEHDEDEDEE